MTCTKPPPGWTCSRDDDHPGACAARREEPSIPVPQATTLEEGAKWIDIHHRMLVQDARRMSRIEERLRRLETPWWRRRRAER